VEFAATVNGSSNGPRGRMIMLSGDSFSLSLWAEEIPTWFSTGSVSVRVLARAVEGAHAGSSDLRLVAAISESEIAGYEERQRQAAEAKRVELERKAAERAKQLTSRSTVNRSDPIEQMVAFKDALPQYQRYIRGINPRLSVLESEDIARNLLVFSYKHGVDPRLVVALIIVESRFNPAATSYKGAQGLGQLMPRTASGMGVSNAYDAKQNLEATVKLVRGHLMKYKDPNKSFVDMNALATAMAAYNAGSGAVRKFGGIPPYKQTQNHIRKVIGIYLKLCGK